MSKSKQEEQQVAIRWDDSDMVGSYANVCNATSTQEEVSLFFGTNQTWDFNQAQKELVIKLNNRVVLSPYAAKRLNVLLSNILSQYEQQFGMLDLEAVDTNTPTSAEIQ